MEKKDPRECCNSLEPVPLLLILLYFIWSLAKSQESGLFQCLNYQCISHLGLGDLAILTLNILPQAYVKEPKICGMRNLMCCIQCMEQTWNDQFQRNYKVEQENQEHTKRTQPLL